MKRDDIGGPIRGRYLDDRFEQGIFRLNPRVYSDPELFELEMKHIETVQGQVFNAGGGHENTLSLLEATAIVNELTGKNLSPALAPEPRTADFQIWISDFRKASQALGWKPQINPRAGYQSIIDWVRREESALRSLYL